RSNYNSTKLGFVCLAFHPAKSPGKRKSWFILYRRLPGDDKAQTARSGAAALTAPLLPAKSFAQSEPPISILPARVASDSGSRAIPVTQKNALRAPTSRCAGVRACILCPWCVQGSSLQTGWIGIPVCCFHHGWLASHCSSGIHFESS